MEDKKNIVVTVCRKSHFNAAHRLHNPAWNDARNKEVFGVCNNPNYHGHNYELIVKVSGEIDKGSGYVMDMKILQDLIDEHITSRFDHKNLSVDVEEFKDLNPTAENIAVLCWNILRKQIPEDKDLSIVLYETERNFVEYSGPGEDCC